MISGHDMPVGDWLMLWRLYREIKDFLAALRQAKSAK